MTDMRSISKAVEQALKALEEKDANNYYYASEYRVLGELDAQTREYLIKSCHCTIKVEYTYNGTETIISV